LGQPVRQEGRRRARAFNPLAGADGDSLRALARGEWMVQGFRNRDIRETLHGTTPDAAERKRQGAAVTRRLALLLAHGLIVRVAKSYSYHLSAAGRRIVSALLAAHASDTSRLTASA
jgi:hypothetical protein